MIKNFFKIYSIFLLLCLLVTDGWAALNPSSQMRYCLSKTSTPQYNFVFNVSYYNTQEMPIVSQTLVARYYQAFGKGDSFGWQTPINPPTLYINGNPTDIYLTFGYTASDYKNGGWGMGFDQYAQYYATNILPGTVDTQITVSGLYQQVAYMSVAIYQTYLDGTEDVIELLDNQAITFNDGCNPNQRGNPSVFAYPILMPQVMTNHINAIDSFRKTPVKPLHAPSITPAGKVDLFRLDKADSVDYIADDIAPDGCSRAYLFGNVPENSFTILRIKVPKTFIENDHPDKKFRSYMARYISVGAHTKEQPVFDFWTVNGRMLKQYEDKAGYAYVFFAPNDYVQNIIRAKNTPATRPPVVTWGKYRGYLLGEPDFAILIRYRVPDPHWQGSPENAVCYAKQADLKPVTRKALGEWLPEAYSGTEQAFLNGQLGQLQKDQSWPEE